MVSEVISSTIEVVSFVDTDVEVIIATVDVDEQSHETSKALVSLQVLDTYCRTIPLMSTLKVKFIIQILMGLCRDNT